MSSEVLKTHEEQVAFVDDALARAEDLRKKKAYGEAISLLVEALRYGLEKAKIYYRLGNVYIDGGDLARAEYAYNRALEMDPNFVNAMHNLAVVYRRQKKMSLYVKTYKKSQRMAIKNPHTTSFNRDQKRRIRRLSVRVFFWMAAGVVVILGIVWLAMR